MAIHDAMYSWHRNYVTILKQTLLEYFRQISHELQASLRYLVVIDPFTGVFTFVSPGFSKNASDRFIVENSLFLDIRTATRPAYFGRQAAHLET